ncbi:unnamed protein product [Orchesella dallaii]|uniref:Uncharacterized protein n=1 Tax=Orchesella dallaii TaxID=48710 RepID=A0ABP1PTC1_9HEXA
MADNNNTNLLFKNGGQATKELEGANHIQGIFYDLLACLGGGENQSLPKDFKQKPMTGFCEILDAFNETIRLRSSGSGTVCEVRSSNLWQTASGNQVLASSSGDTLESHEPKESDSQLSTKSEELRSSDSITSGRTPTPEEVQKYVEGQIQIETSDVEEYQDTFDVSEDLLESITPEDKEKGETDYSVFEDINNNDLVVNECSLTEDKTVSEYCNPDYLQEIGPPLDIPQESTPVISQNEQDFYIAIQEEMNKYSDDIKEIERILTANIAPQSQHSMTMRSSNVSLCQAQLIHCIPGYDDAESLTDGFMTPTSALEAMHDAASVASSHFAPDVHLSNYQSCTSFASCNGSRNYNAEDIERTPSFYMDCLNLEEEEGNDHFLKALESVNPSFICSGVQQIHQVCEPLIIAGENPTDQGDIVSYKPSNKEVTEGKIDDVESLDKEPVNCEEVQEYFHDANDSPPSTATTATSSKKLKRKKKRGYGTESSADERLWSSASPSELEDLD